MEVVMAAVGVVAVAVVAATPLGLQVQTTQCYLVGPQLGKWVL